MSQGCPIPCSIQSLPERYVIDKTYYTQFVIGPSSIPIISAQKVSHTALIRTLFQLETIINSLFEKDRILVELQKYNMKIALYSSDETIESLPESKYKNNTEPGKIVTGLFIVNPQQNFGAICLVSEKIEDIVLHEIGHSIHLLGYFGNATFTNRLTNIFRTISNTNKWGNTYAATSEREYWAEATKLYFDCEIESQYTTMANLSSFDPDLYSLLSTTYSRTKTRTFYKCNENPICNISSSSFPSTFECPKTSIVNLDLTTKNNTDEGNKNNTGNSNGNNNNGNNKIQPMTDSLKYVIPIIIALVILGCLCLCIGCVLNRRRINKKREKSRVERFAMRNI